MAEDYCYLRETLLNPVSRQQSGSSKVSIVGCGNVGTAVAYALLLKNLCSEIVLYDIDEKRLDAEVCDLQAAASFGNARVHGSTSPEATADSRLCVVTAGVKQRRDERREELLERNVQILSSIVPSLAQLSPCCVILVVTNPVEALTYMAWRLSGFPWRRVLGSGTNLDAARLRLHVGRHLELHPAAVQACVFGEHGDRQIPDLPNMSVAGVRPLELEGEAGQASRAYLERTTHKVKNSAYAMIKDKGFTSWGVALSVAAICDAILNDTREVLPVTVCIEGCKHSAGQDTFVSMPCALCENGVHAVMKSHMPQPLLEELYSVIPHLFNAQIQVDTLLEKCGR